MSINFYDHSITTSGTITSPSGNFTTLVVNGTSVSNFNSSISGLLPTIANSGDNRILTSTGSSVGINAEANLTFDGTNLNLNNQTASTIASFDSSKNLVSLATATYPSLTELSYVKGVTSALQTQIDSKAATSTTITAGSGLAGGGSLAANRTIDIGQGDGITVSADSIAVDSTVIRTTGTQTITGNKTISVSTGVGLTLTNTGTGYSFVVNDESGDSTPFTVDSSGNVGIKSTSLASSLNVVGNSAFYQSANGTPTLGSKNFYCATFENFSAGYGLAIGGVNTSTGSTFIQGQSFVSSVAYDLLLQPLGGNVGIGTSSPSTRLQINGQTRVTDGTTNIDFVSSSAVGYIGTQTNHPLVLRTNDTEKMRITADGNVGIGTSSPGTTLDIQRASSDAAIFVQGQTSSTGATIQIYSGAGLGYIGTRNNYPILFTTNNTERIRITADGNVGIGTATVSSGFKLDLRGRLLSYTTASDGLITVQGLQTESAGTGKAAIQIDVNGKGGFAWQNDASSGTRSLKLIENSGYGSGDTTLVTVLSGGNVGIGATPSYRLHVVGNASAANNVVCYLNNTGSTRSRLAFQDTSTTYAPDISSIGNDIVFDTVGIEALRIDSDRNLRINGAAKGTSAVGCVHIKNGTAPSASITDGIILFAADISSSSELRVRDEVGNVTTLSPHAFPLIPEGPSEDMAWSYYSERDGKKINIDMLKAIRLLEKLTGEKLVYTA